MSPEPGRPNHARTDDDDYDRYYDLDGLAHYSGLSISALRRFLKDPKNPLPHARVMPAGSQRGRILVRKRAFDAWVERFAPKPAAVDDFSWIRERRR